MYDLNVPFVRRWIMWAGARAGSYLKGAGVGQVLLWLVVALPSLVFVAIPALTILVWLSLFWLIEMFCFVILKPFSRKAVHTPKLRLKMS
jgi:hypothetical protein